tara:strand:+ start:245 stop:361 length:117 start_codon:yes stop_codon:yes gene_type:complete
MMDEKFIIAYLGIEDVSQISLESIIKELSFGCRYGFEN